MQNAEIITGADTKIMLYSWGANNEQILADNLIDLGLEVVWYDKPCRHYTRDLELAADMIPFIHKEGIEAVVSFNYFPIISMICDTCKIPYYSWVYDCPHHTLYAKHVMLSSNRIGVFDRDMVRRLEEKGVRTVRHVPLSVDVSYFEHIIQGARQEERDLYRNDISFVGSLYTDEHNYYDELLGDRERSVTDDLIGRQCFCYDADLLEDAVHAGILESAGIRAQMEENGLMLGEDYLVEPEEVLKAVVLEKKVTVEERRILLHQIAERFGAQYRFALYSASDLAGYPLLQKHHKGVVDYHSQMPLVFAQSRINLNISLRSIHSGIPLRVLDIMACGGFVLTNRQPEIDEFFRENVEYVCYDSAEECMDKIDYYLRYEDKRKCIAQAGRQAVKERFGYRQGISKLFTQTSP